MTVAVDRLVTHVQRTMSEWQAWPGGWPREIERALLDSVLSLRARYGTADSGVRAALNRWAEHRQSESLDDLAAIASFGSAEGLAEVLGNRGRLSGGRLKAEGAIQVAQRLQEHGVRHAQDVSADADTKRVWTGVSGLGPVSWHYFLMLLGVPDVKADVMVRRFVADATGEDPGAERTRALVHQAAQRLNVSPTELDHAIWAYQRTAEND